MIFLIPSIISLFHRFNVLFHNRKLISMYMEEIWPVMTARNSNNILETKVKKEKTDWININVKVKSSDLSILNQRLKLLGFDTLGQLTKELVNGTFPHVTEEKQIDSLYKNDDKSGQKSLLEGGYNRDFYERMLIPLRILDIVFMAQSLHIVELSSYKKKQQAKKRQ